MGIRSRQARIAVLLIAFTAALSGASIATAQNNHSMAEIYEPEYNPLKTRLGFQSTWKEHGLPTDAFQEVKNLERLPKDTTFIAETESFDIYFKDGLVTSQVDSATGTIYHSLPRVINGSDNKKKTYSNNVTVRVIYPDGSEELVKPQYAITVADDIYYYPDAQQHPSRKYAPGSTVTIPLKVNGKNELPVGSKVVEDRYGSIENARQLGVKIDISKESGELSVTFPEDRTGSVWFRTELIYADGTYDEIHYSFEVTDKPTQSPGSSSFRSLLSSH